MVNQQTNIMAVALGLLIQKFGSKCDTGYEVFIPSEVIKHIPPAGVVQPVNDPKGVYLRYYPNHTIDGEIKTESIVKP